jgi:hypothetical protein
MKWRVAISVIPLLGLALQACAAPDDGALPAGAAGNAAAAAESTEPAPAADAPQERLFTREALRGKGCPMLSREDVADVVGIAASGIETNRGMDCLYSWNGGAAALGSIRVHRSARGAATQYAGATQDLTAAEMQAGIDEVKARMAEEVAAGGMRDDQAAVAGDLVDSRAGSTVTNVDVQGVGDRASHDGNRIKVLVANAVFDLAADSGDDFDPELSRRLAQRVIRNMEAAR